MNLKENIGTVIARYGVALILLWIGIYKFTPTEAKDIVDVVSHSPFMSWMYQLFSIPTTSMIIGVLEIITALLFIISPFNNKMSLIGGILGTATFFITLSFIITTEKMFSVVDGIHLTNFFILKDIVFLGVSIQMIIDNWNKK